MPDQIAGALSHFESSMGVLVLTGWLRRYAGLSDPASDSGATCSPRTHAFARSKQWPGFRPRHAQCSCAQRGPLEHSRKAPPLQPEVPSAHQKYLLVQSSVFPVGVSGPPLALLLDGYLHNYPQNCAAGRGLSREPPVRRRLIFFVSRHFFVFYPSRPRGDDVLAGTILDRTRGTMDSRP